MRLETLLNALCVVGLWPMSLGRAAPVPEPVHGAVTRRTVLVPDVVRIGNDVQICSLLIVPIHVNNAVRKLQVTVVDFVPVRWRVSHSRIWAIDGCGHVEKIYRYELPEFLKGQLLTPLMVGPAGEAAPNPDLVIHPLQDIRIQGRFCDIPDQQLHYDILPVNRNEVILFALTNIPRRPQNRKERETPEWSMTAVRSSWSMDKNGVKKDEADLWKQGEWKPLDSLEVSFREPFQVLARGEVYYFLTASGRLYRSGARAFLTNRRSVEPVWDDANRPITHFITDADAERTFLFCKPVKPGEPGVYFELGPKPEPKPYDLSKVKPSKADEPLKGVLERARYLAAQKLLKNPAPPKEEKKP